MRGIRIICFSVFLILIMLVVYTTQAQIFDDVKSQVKEHTLSNGMKFIVLERHEVPIVSFHIYADVGSAQEVDGITGISHLLEHLAFKGTKVVGTKDYATEAKLLEQTDQLYDQLTHEQNAINPDSEKIKALQAEFDKANEAAHGLVAVGEYEDMINKQGASYINAYTGYDATQYIVSLPSNRLEFWMAMESDRFMNPIFREFFEERDVVMEERRLGENRPQGKLYEDFIAVAYKSHPYHHSILGHMSDLRRITRKDVESYFHTYYNPSNLTVAIVGDVNADEVFKMAEIYFSRIPSGPKPEPLRTEEPEQWGERRVSVVAQAQPFLYVGYHRPDARSNESLAFDGLANILGDGRSSRLYKSLVKEKKIAINIGASNNYVGDKYPSLFVVDVIPAMDHTTAECLEAIEAEIDKLKMELVTDDELTKFKRQTKKSAIDSMKWNEWTAELLTYNDVILGDWKETYDRIKKIDAVTAADIQSVAQKYLIQKNRTIGEIVSEK